MQNKLFSERMKRFPCDTAMEAWHFSPIELRATSLNCGPASMMTVSPASERK